MNRKMRKRVILVALIAFGLLLGSASAGYWTEIFGEAGTGPFKLGFHVTATLTDDEGNIISQRSILAMQYSGKTVTTYNFKLEYEVKASEDSDFNWDTLALRIKAQVRVMEVTSSGIGGYTTDPLTEWKEQYNEVYRDKTGSVEVSIKFTDKDIYDPSNYEDDQWYEFQFRWVVSGSCYTTWGERIYIDTDSSKDGNQPVVFADNVLVQWKDSKLNVEGTKFGDILSIYGEGSGYDMPDELGDLSDASVVPLNIVDSTNARSNMNTMGMLVCFAAAIIIWRKW